MSKNLSELTGRQGIKNNLFDRYGQLVKDDPEPNVTQLKKIADEFLIGTANLQGSITFYDFLKPENQGKKVYICNGSVCMCAGTQEKLHHELLEHFDQDEIGEMCCLGRCYENASFQYQGQNYSGKQNLPELFADETNSQVESKDHYAVSSIGPAILTSSQNNPDTVVLQLKDILSRTENDILEEIDRSGLRGRGGAGFPIAIKLRTCKETDADIKFIVCNADEGDPGAFSDRYLLEEKPYDVLLGMMIAGFVTGAVWGIVYIRGEYPESVQIVKESIEQLRSAGLLGENIHGRSFDFEFKVIQAQGSYICGEETALINSIEGQRPEVRIRPPFPAEQGLFNKPTIVNNVETLAALPFIIKQGGEKYATLGTGRSKGTKLLSLDSHFVRPGICEVEMGTSLSKVIYDCGGGFKNPVKALHIGGPLGGLVPIEQVDKLTVDFESFAENGFLLGHASVVAIPETFPMIRYLEHLFEFAADESCGKCFPCRLGTRRAQEMLHKAQKEDYRIGRDLIDDLLHTLEIGSLCAHGGGIPLPVRNALKYFDDELKPFLA